MLVVNIHALNLRANPLPRTAPPQYFFQGAVDRILRLPAYPAAAAAQDHFLRGGRGGAQNGKSKAACLVDHHGRGFVKRRHQQQIRIAHKAVRVALTSVEDHRVRKAQRLRQRAQLLLLRAASDEVQHRRNALPAHAGKRAERAVDTLSYASRPTMTTCSAPAG